MLMRRVGMPFARWSGALALIAALVTAASWRADVHAQLPLQPVGSPFEMTGFIQSATLDGGADPFRGGTITLNNHLVVVPRNTIFQMPATSLTWAELFTLAPAPYAPTQTGLALNDVPKPLTTFEVGVQGTRIEQAQGAFPAGTYVAGLLFLDQLSLMTHQGFVNFIDYTTGDMYVGGMLNTATGTRVRINDPIGRFGRAMTHDVRFTIDEDNPTIKTETAFPLCIPRTANGLGDPLCPDGNRPRDTTGRPRMIFTMPVATAPTPAEIANPAIRPVPLGGDPWRMAPFMVGDYVTVKGPLAVDGAGSRYVDAWGIDGNVGIFTTPGTLPAYVSIDVMVMGIGPNNDVALAQEGAKRTVVEGFTTDISTTISINAVDVDACTGTETDRLWALQAVDPGAPTGAVAGRWRFRPGAPLFNLKGFPFLPPTRELHAFSLNGSVASLNGLSAGEYTAPIFEFGGPENLGIGNPKVPMNFETMAFLAQGSGPRAAFGTGVDLGVVRQLFPWPGQTAPVLKACPVPPIANAGPNQTVRAAVPVTLSAAASSDPNAPPLALTFAWTQTSGTPVVLTNANTVTATFTSPNPLAGGPVSVLGFQVAVSNGSFTVTAPVTITVDPRAAVSTTTVTGTAVATGNITVNGVALAGVQIVSTPFGTLTLRATATDNAPGATGTFRITGISLLSAGVNITPAVTNTAAGNTVTTTATVNATTLLHKPLGASTYLITYTATDALGNVNVSTTTIAVR